MLQEYGIWGQMHGKVDHALSLGMRSIKSFVGQSQNWRRSYSHVIPWRVPPMTVTFWVPATKKVIHTMQSSWFSLHSNIFTIPIPVFPDKKNIPNFAGWCSTLTLLLICLSLSRDNGHPLLIWSLNFAIKTHPEVKSKGCHVTIHFPTISGRSLNDSADSTQLSEIMDLWSRRSPEITGRFKKALRLWTCDDECPLKKQKTRLIRMFDDKNIFLKIFRTPES